MIRIVDDAERPAFKLQMLRWDGGVPHHSAAAPTWKLELCSARRPFLAKTGEHGVDPGDLAEDVVTAGEKWVLGVLLAECKAVVRFEESNTKLGSRTCRKETS